MKTVLCYGDSNTWGYIGGTGERFAPDVRWPGVMQAALGSGYRVIEEGLNGRTTVWDDPIEGDKNGEAYLRPCLDTHAPIDLVILMLGTNDLKRRFSLPAIDIAAGAEKLVRIIQQSEAGPEHAAPQVLLVCPAAVQGLTELAEMLGEDAEARSRRMPAHYAADGGALRLRLFRRVVRHIGKRSGRHPSCRRGARRARRRPRGRRARYAALKTAITETDKHIKGMG